MQQDWEKYKCDLRPLTDKERKVVNEFENARHGLGAITEQNIRHNYITGWADIIAATPEEELFLREEEAVSE